MNKTTIGTLIFVLVAGAAGASFLFFNKGDQKESIKLTTAQPIRPMDGPDSFALNVCEEVPQKIIENIIGKVIEKTESFSTNVDTNCKYFTNTDKYEHVLIQVSYLSVENQKKGQEMMDRAITTNESISMEHFIALQDDEQINAIYLVMTPEKFVRIDRTRDTADNEQLLNLAEKVAKIILGK